ncbi:hypothetical protein BJV74DRAFT_792568 [Russula compacta]|nr:hypothetical protein BJV74DRAFT_792568 [Russula compacta]
MSQLKILRAYAKMDDASITSKLPPTVYFSHTLQTLTVFDAFPKALFHFLVLPRLIPVPVPVPAAVTASPSAAADSVEEEEEEGGRGSRSRRQGESRRSVVDNDDKSAAEEAEALTNLRTLLHRCGAAAANVDVATDKNARAERTLRALSDEATRLQSEIEREMLARYGFTWTIWAGFHAVPSMEHLHLHVISSDLVAPALKTKRHYNSFSPRTGFFIPLAKVIRACFDDDNQHQLAKIAHVAPEEHEPRLKDALVCFRCSETAKNMPALKKHLQEEFDALRKREVGKLKRKRETEPETASGSHRTRTTARTKGEEGDVQKT